MSFRKRTSLRLLWVLICGYIANVWADDSKQPHESPADLLPLKYNNPDLIVDLGIGLWAHPLPMTFDRDGENDLVVSCPAGESV